jgi:hypothetical protein
MEIKDILSKLNLDLSNAEVKRGAIEAIDAILASRAPIGGGDLLGGGAGIEQEVELDPDLIQPSVKQASSGSDDDVEIEDEEKILDQIKHKDSEDPIENTNSDGDSSSSDKESGSNTDSTDATDNSDNTDSDSTSNEPNKSDEDKKPDQNEPKNDSSANSKNSSSSDDFDENDNDDELESDGALEDDEFDDDDEFDGDGDNNIDLDDLVDPDIEDASADDDFDGDDGDGREFDNDADDDKDEDDDLDFDEDDLIDDDLKDATEDEAEKIKRNARAIKRERVVAAGKKALENAQAKNAPYEVIQELTKALEALEALTEAITRSLKDISDTEFNSLINRVLDAIEACGNSELTYTSAEEKEARVKEIKADMSNATTQNELAAEDIAKIRAETQALKAREKEIAKYAPRTNTSFGGFKDFLDSLSKAIKRQVSTTQARDNSWSQINRKYSGTGVLRPGKKIKDLPNTKIPVIDFYFDCSSSWKQRDIEIGKKAVEALADLQADGQIKINLFYFADYVSTEYNEVAGGWTSAWNYIVKNIIATKATNVVIMTDSDMENQGSGVAGVNGFLKYNVPGHVWYLWKNGKNAQRLARDLTGKKGVQQFSFSANDL